MRTSRTVCLLSAILSLSILCSCSTPKQVFTATDVLRVQEIIPFAIRIPRDAKVTDRIEIQLADKDGPIKSITAGRIDWFPDGIVKVFMRDTPPDNRRFDVLGKHGDLTTLYVEGAQSSNATTLNMADRKIHPMGTCLAYYGAASSTYPLPPNELPPSSGTVVRIVLRPATENEIRIDKLRGWPVE